MKPQDEYISKEAFTFPLFCLGCLVFNTYWGSGLDTHCMAGLISAKLSNNAHYENIKQMYKRIVKKGDFTDGMKSSFSQLTVYLDNYETDR